jgi:hypothetical protein
MRCVAIGLVLAAGVTAAAAQISPQFPQTLPPSPPSRPLLPPTVSPGPAQPPQSNNSFGDKAARCMNYGATQGVRPGDIPQYTRECVNAQ